MSFRYTHARKQKEQRPIAAGKHTCSNLIERSGIIVADFLHSRLSWSRWGKQRLSMREQHHDSPVRKRHLHQRLLKHLALFLLLLALLAISLLAMNQSSGSRVVATSVANRSASSGSGSFLSASSSTQRSGLTLTHTTTRAPDARIAPAHSLTTGNQSDTPATCDTLGVQFDPLTGLPSSVPIQNGTPVVCAMTINACQVPAGGAPDAADWLLGSTNGLLIATRSADTYGNALVQQLRTFSFALALALLALPFCLVGFQLLRGASGSGRANASELFSRLGLALITVMASFYLIQACIDLESAIVNTLFTKIPAPAVATFMPSTNNWQCYIHQFFGSLFNLSAYSDQHSATTIDTPTYLTDENQTTITIMSNLNYYIMTLLSVLLAIQLAVRLALLNAYIIVSPLTIISGALGQRGTEIMHAWIKGFGSLLCVQILQLLVLWVGIQLIPSAWLSGGLNPGANWVIDMFTKMLPITLLGLTLSVPRLLQNPATTVLSTVSSSIGGAMTGVILIIRGV